MVSWCLRDERVGLEGMVNPSAYGWIYGTDESIVGGVRDRERRLAFNLSPTEFPNGFACALGMWLATLSPLQRGQSLAGRRGVPGLDNVLVL